MILRSLTNERKTILNIYFVKEEKKVEIKRGMKITAIFQLTVDTIVNELQINWLIHPSQSIWWNGERYSHFHGNEREKKIHLKVSNYVSIPFNFRQWPSYQLYRSFCLITQNFHSRCVRAVCVYVCMYVWFIFTSFTRLKMGILSLVIKKVVFIIWCHDIYFLLLFYWSTTDMIDIWEFFDLFEWVIYTIFIAMFILLHAIWQWGPAILPYLLLLLFDMLTSDANKTFKWPPHKVK